MSAQEVMDELATRLHQKLLIDWRREANSAAASLAKVTGEMSYPQPNVPQDVHNKLHLRANKLASAALFDLLWERALKSADPKSEAHDGR